METKRGISTTWMMGYSTVVGSPILHHLLRDGAEFPYSVPSRRHLAQMLGWGPYEGAVLDPGMGVSTSKRPQ